MKRHPLGHIPPEMPDGERVLTRDGVAILRDLELVRLWRRAVSVVPDVALTGRVTLSREDELGVGGPC